jgi:hypothetical protein
MADTGFDILAMAESPAVGQTYRAFDMIIRSDIPFPELERAAHAGEPDLRIRLRPISRDITSATRSTYAYGPDEQFLHWPTVGSFLIRGADTIDVDPAPGASSGLLRLPLLGPVMALLMHQRERLVLHASAVRVGGRLIVFAGDKGAGKSTTTAAAVERGHALFTDDLLPVTIAPDGRAMAYPGFPSLKLVTDCASLFSLERASELAAPVDGFPKRIRRLNQPFMSAPASPARIYILKRSDGARTAELSQADALCAVMRFAYVPLFQSKPWTPPETRRHFSQCAALAAGTRVARLETPSDLSRLNEIIDCVEDDLATDTP